MTDILDNLNGQKDMASGLTAGFRGADSWSGSDGLDPAEAFARLEHAPKQGPVKLFLVGGAGLVEWQATGGLKWEW